MRIRARIAGDEELVDCTVAGEVQSSLRSAAGHDYITLRDAESTLDIVRFRGAIRPGEAPPSVGEIVVARGRIDLYAPRSRYQLVATSVVPLGGLGILSRELEALKRRLQEEGLFDSARKRPIPESPRGIGIVTSRSGAVLHDVLRVLRRRAPLSRLLLVHAAVQGATAPAEIVDAIERLNARARAEARAGRVDAPTVILLARGGGSADDLSAFNSEALLRAIAASRLPIVSAVGHESDVTLADLIADARAGTPSIGAAMLSPADDELRAEPMRLLQRSARAVIGRLAAGTGALDGERRALRRASPLLHLGREGERLALLSDDLAAALRRSLRSAAVALRQGSLLLGALSPYGVLERGYAIVTASNGRSVRSWREAPKGAMIRVRFADGGLAAEVVASPAGEPERGGVVR